MKKTIRVMLVFSLVLTLMTVRSAMAAETAGQTLAKLEKLSPEERKKVVIEGAKKEGEITIYTSMRQDQSTPFSKRFNKRYPFLKVNTFRTASSRQVAKVQAEFNAGRHQVDVINGNAAAVYTIKGMGVLAPYHSPERKFFSSTYKDKKGYFTPVYVIPVVLGYNPGLVKKGRGPQELRGVAGPQVEGKDAPGHR